MNALESIQLNVPLMDVSFLKSLAQRMGWEMTINKKNDVCHLDKAMTAAKSEPLYEATDIDELMSALAK